MRAETLIGPAHVAQERLWARVPEGLAVPNWAALVTASERAHAAFPNVWAIAWDWVITPTGAVLLEGNSGWGTAMPQLLTGGLLRHAAAAPAGSAARC